MWHLSFQGSKSPEERGSFQKSENISKSWGVGSEGGTKEGNQRREGSVLNQPIRARAVLLGKFILSSPLTWVLVSYLAAALCLLAQKAVSDGVLVPGTAKSDILGLLLVPTTLVASVAGFGVSIRNLKQNVRSIESLVGLLAALPILFVWIYVARRIFYAYSTGLGYFS